jgi:diguanylate cyclase (GGDEF)-like protein
VDEQPPAVEPVAPDAADRSDPDDVARAAQQRDTAALARDQAAETRDAASADQARKDRISTAEDRAAAALDREESALDRHGAAEQLESSYRDELTGVLSRAAGRDQLGQVIDRAHRIAEPLVIVFVDVDHLKLINDAHGHAHGDHVLHEVGSALRQGLRSYDVLVRYGGDEFVCALVGAELATAEMRFGDIARTLAGAIAGTSVSVGFAELREGETLDKAIDRADRDMYVRRSAARTTDR